MIKKIEIDLITLVAIILLIVGVVLLVGYYYTYQENSCVKNPVDYANNNKQDYWWDIVSAFRY